jgi:hypothetical protein
MKLKSIKVVDEIKVKKFTIIGAPKLKSIKVVDEIKVKSFKVVD